MEKFLTLTAVAVPLPVLNVDTDIIIPARALKTTTRDGLGAMAFHALRFDGEGGLRDDCVFNQARYQAAGILIAGANFGCGSSREHAPWALADMGIRCVIAPSFADIFASNCAKNGILCVTLPPVAADALARMADGARFTVDLVQQIVITPAGGTVAFHVEPARREALMAGQDEIGATLARVAEIEIFERRRAQAQPWHVSARLDVV